MTDTTLPLACVVASLAFGLCGLAVSAACWNRAFGSGEGAAWRNRWATSGLVLAFVLATRALLRDPDERANLQYLVVLILGYGHLIGSAVFSRARFGRLLPRDVSPGLTLGFVSVSVLTLLGGYTWALAQLPGIIVPLLAIATWHSAENDLALGRAYTDGMRLGSVPRGLEHHLAALGITAVILLVGALTPAWRDFAPTLRPLLPLGSDPMILRTISVLTGIALLLRRTDCVARGFSVPHW